MKSNHEHSLKTTASHSFTGIMLTIFTTLFFMSANVTAAPTVRVIEQNLPSGGNIKSFVYTPYEKACYQEAFQADAEGESQAVKAARISSVPKGGIVTINFEARKTGIVETEKWIYVVTDDSGKELYRRQGLPSIASPGGSDGLYNYDALLIPVKLPDSFRINIISRSHNAQNVYQVTKGSSAIASL
jgi:hypothetical protein